MEKVNGEVAEVERREQKAKQRAEQQRRSHEKNVRDVSGRLRFD
jgi:hypothetical protein